MNIEHLNVAQRRSVFSQLAEQTPGIYYYSADLAANEQDPLDVIAPLSLVARNAVHECPQDKVLSVTLDGLDNAGDSYGNWMMDLEWRPLNEAEFEQMDVAVHNMTAEDIRAMLRDAVNTTPVTIYHDAERLTGLDAKQTGDGTKMGDAGNACMLMASRLRHTLKENEVFEITFVGQPIGVEPGKVIKVSVTRLSMV